jgi:non-ribosomal peptide synthetase component F
MVDDDACGLARVPLLPAGATRAGAARSSTPRACPRPRCASIHRLFEQQVRLQPDAPAVEYEGVALSLRRAQSPAPTASPTA